MSAGEELAIRAVAIRHRVRHGRAMVAATMRRAAGALVIASLGVAAGAAPASAAPCRAPDEPTWRSCLTTAHVELEDGRVRLKRASPRLVMRYDECPATLRTRTVALRTRRGRLLDRAVVDGRCASGVARWTVTLRPEDADLRSGTVVRTFWTGVADKNRAPKVRLK
jgi:hypothetical protein